MSLQNIIEKIQKLRNLSSSPNIHEAHTAAAMAEKLIAEYQLTEAQLTADNQMSAPIIEAQTFLYETGKVVQWKSRLALLLANHYGVYIYNSVGFSEKGRKTTNYAMVGRESDIAILQYQFEYLIRTIEMLGGMACPSEKRGVSVERNNWCLGAVDGFMEKLDAEKKASRQNATSAALVVLDNKHREAMQWAHNKHSLTRSRQTSYGSKDREAYERGKMVGGNIQVNAGMNGGGSTPRLG